MKGIRRTIGTAKEQKAPATADLIMKMLAHIPDTLGGKRDWALIALGFAGAFRRSELVALTMADLVEAPDGYRVLIRHSKTDQDGQGQEVAIPRGYRLRPVEAVQTWLAAAEINDGPVFRPVLKGGRLQPVALKDHAVAAVVKRYAELAGLGSRAVCRPQPARRVSDQRGRGGGVGIQNDGSITPSFGRYASVVRALGRRFQGPRRGGLLVTTH